MRREKTIIITLNSYLHKKDNNRKTFTLTYRHINGLNIIKDSKWYSSTFINDTFQEVDHVRKLCIYKTFLICVCDSYQSMCNHDI